MDSENGFTLQPNVFCLTWLQQAHVQHLVHDNNIEGVFLGVLVSLQKFFVSATRPLQIVRWELLRCMESKFLSTRVIAPAKLIWSTSTSTVSTEHEHAAARPNTNRCTHQITRRTEFRKPRKRFKPPSTYRCGFGTCQLSHCISPRHRSGSPQQRLTSFNCLHDNCEVARVSTNGHRWYSIQHKPLG